MVANVVQMKQYTMDSMRNFLAGFGIFGRDKSASQQFTFTALDQTQLEYAYRGDWLARKIVDAPAFDCCRAWRQWEAENEQIEKLEKCEKGFSLQAKLMSALTKARLYGGSAIVMGIEGQKFEEELEVESVGEGDLKFVHVVTRWQIMAGPLMRDITSPWYGEPIYYQRTNSPVPPQIEIKPPLEESTLGYKAGETIFIHPSRVVRLLGSEYPDIERAQDSWSDSILQPVVDAIKTAGLVNSSIAAMISEAKLDVIKIPGLIEMLNTKEGTAKLFDRFSGAMAAKSVVNTTLVDSAEEWERINLQMSNMDKVMAMYLNVASGAADIPATRLIGRSPAGENATGESDLRNYYDRLSSDQIVRLTPALTRLDDVLIRHALGSRPEEVHYTWKPLWQLSATEQSSIWLQKAQAHKIDADSGLINPDVLREVRVNQCIEDGFYPGLETAMDEFDIEPDEDDHDLLALKQGAQQLQHGEVDLSMKKESLKQMKKPQPNGGMNGGRPPPE
jgi:uncharacterized protein